MSVGGRRRAHPVGQVAARERFERLFQAHVRPLMAYALRRVDQPEDAADVVADTMLVAWRRQDDVPAGDEARLWLYGVARRVLANHRRGAARRNHLGDRLREELRQVVVPDHAEAVGTGLIVRTVLAQMPELEREVLQLTAWEGLDPREVALVLSISPSTARTRLHRARRRLRRRLDLVGSESNERSTASGHVGHDERWLVRQREDER